MGHDPPSGQNMTQFTRRAIMGVNFETTERLAHTTLKRVIFGTQTICNRYSQLEPVGVGVSGLVW